MAEWPTNPDGSLAMFTKRLDLENLLREGTLSARSWTRLSGVCRRRHGGGGPAVLYGGDLPTDRLVLELPHA